MNKETGSHKYTSDGRKVVVIGNLNSNEIIVQEIFVSGDAEIPSGEHFVVKSLHDKPVESWKEKRLREMDERYERDSAAWEKKINQMNQAQRRRHESLEEMGKCLHALAKNWNTDALDTLEKFVTGKITHLVKLSWYKPEIVPLNEAVDMLREYGRGIEGIRLVSLFGRSDGNLAWGLHQYYDGSGGRTEIVPCTSMEDAIAVLDDFVSTIIEKHGADKWMIEAQEKFGLQNPSNKAKKELYKKCAASLQEQVSGLAGQMEKAQAELADAMIKARGE